MARSKAGAGEGAGQGQGQGQGGAGQELPRKSSTFLVKISRLSLAPRFVMVTKRLLSQSTLEQAPTYGRNEKRIDAIIVSVNQHCPYREYFHTIVSITPMGPSYHGEHGERINQHLTTDTNRSAQCLASKSCVRQ